MEHIKKPLENYRDIDVFKIYVSDLELLCTKKDLEENDILYIVDEINDFKGGMAFNLFFQYTSKKIGGNYNNVEGLPIAQLYQNLRNYIPLVYFF